MSLLLIGPEAAGLRPLLSERGIADPAAMVAVGHWEDAATALAQPPGFRAAIADWDAGPRDLLRFLASRGLELPLLLCGRAASPRDVAASIRAGAADYLPIPVDVELLESLLPPAAPEAGEPVHADPRTAAALRLARSFAAHDATVLLTGESGTGKEVVARYIHRRSRRSGGPFVAVNCAAIPEGVLESEMFGHERGAFTGALGRRIGKFEEARGGTLLLDEVSEMEPRLQAKLLRAIQERRISRLGSGEELAVDVRIIATSNRDLAAWVAEGRFRQDLYFRLDVLRLELPPLRARPADIPVLAAHFLRRFAREAGRPEIALAPAALARLAAHPWPGNVRELENAVQRAVLLGEAAMIEALTPGAERSGGRTAGPAAAAEGLVGRTVAEVERELIVGTLARLDGNRTRAAATLGISIRTLRNKLREYAAVGALPDAAR
jgi:DNA-binding NtrC family response regulator